MRPMINYLVLSACILATTNLATAGELLDFQPRIVGGNTVDINNAPSTVALLNNNRIATSGSFFQSQFCGGTLISPRWVLTAAHCVRVDGVTTPAAEISVLMGSTILDEPVNQPVNITEVIPHPNYNQEAITSDIALLRLEYDAPVIAAPLETGPSQLNDQAFIAGWGALNPGDQGQQQFFPRGLHGAFLVIVPCDECGTRFPRYNGRVSDLNLCAGVPDGGIDSCQGDSGGPLYRFDSDNPTDLRLAGITSWGFGCGGSQTPGVYTRVAAFSDWIADSTGDFSFTQPIIQIPDNQPVEAASTPAAAQPPESANALSNINSLGNLGGTGGGAAAGFLLPLLSFAVLLRRRILQQAGSLRIDFVKHLFREHQTGLSCIEIMVRSQSLAIGKMTPGESRRIAKSNSGGSSRTAARTAARAASRSATKSAVQANIRAAARLDEKPTVQQVQRTAEPQLDAPAHSDTETDSDTVAVTITIAGANPATTAHADALTETDSHAKTNTVAAQSTPQTLLLRMYPVALATLVASVAGLALWVQQTEADETAMTALALDQQPIGRNRDEVVDMARQLWQHDPVCTIIRTGSGNNRRAVFLETCSFSAGAENTVCGAKPAWVEYRFLESSMVQIAFEYNEIFDENTYRRCVVEQTKSLYSSHNQTVTIESDFRTTLSDAKAIAQIYLLKHTI